MPYLSASAVVMRYEEALYQVYAPFPRLLFNWLIMLPPLMGGDIKQYLTFDVCLV